MTVISTVITQYCTAHASDSLITSLRSDGRLEQREWKKSKLVAVPHWRGIIGYWGIAELGTWSTIHWLRDQAGNASSFTSAEQFAKDLGGRLNAALKALVVRRPLDLGIGIHLSVYERISGYWIPELFHIRNWADTSYTSLLPQGVVVSRETYATLTGDGDRDKHGDDSYRVKVHLELRGGRMLIFNNGDPRLFNPPAQAILGLMEELRKRHLLANQNRVETYRRLARRPIEVVSRAQADFCKQERRAVGGKPHDLAVTPGGLYSSDTGDYPGRFGTVPT